MSDELDDLKMDLKMEQLRAIGEPLGLSFGAGVSKASARDAIRSARRRAQDACAQYDALVEAPIEFAAGVEAPSRGVVAVNVDPGPVDAIDNPHVDVQAYLKSQEGGAREITRVGHNGAWWCPHCDHCSPKTADACGGCGATRNDNQAVL